MTLSVQAPDFGPFVAAIPEPFPLASQESSLCQRSMALTGQVFGSTIGRASTAFQVGRMNFAVSFQVLEPMQGSLALGLGSTRAIVGPGSGYSFSGPGISISATWFQIVFEGAPTQVDWSGVLQPGTYTLAVEIRPDLSGFFGDANCHATLEAAPRLAPADLNADGVVSGADLGILLAAWGQPGTGDLDCSGAVDGGDLGQLLASWGG